MENVFKKIVLMSILALFYTGYVNCTQIFVRNLDGRTTQIELDDIATRDELYDLIALDNALDDSVKLRLMHAGHEINPDLSLLYSGSVLGVMAVPSKARKLS